MKETPNLKNLEEKTAETNRGKSEETKADDQLIDPRKRKSLAKKEAFENMKQKVITSE